MNEIKIGRRRFTIGVAAAATALLSVRRGVGAELYAKPAYVRKYRRQRNSRAAGAGRFGQAPTCVPGRSGGEGQRNPS